MIEELEKEPFWVEKPSLEFMRDLLQKNGLEAPRSGARCVQLIYEHRERIRMSTPPSPIPAPHIPAPTPPTPSMNYPLEDQCEDSIKSESEERLKSCLASSFRTDNGTIMLENDLLLFISDKLDPVEWVQTMLDEWLPRLDSKKHEEFKVGLHLWILSNTE